MLQGTPILVLKEGTERERGKSATQNNIAAARAIADAVRSTLGPRGMDKMLVDSMGDITITNDGVTILKEVDVEHPAAKMIVEVAKTQDQQCGDGTTTAVVLAGELLKRAETLLEKNIHPTVITRGYQIALQEAQRLLEKEIGTTVKVDDERMLIDCATTAMGSKGVYGSRDELAKIAVQAVRKIMEKRGDRIVADVDQIKVEKRHGGTIADTQLIDGIILDKERGHPRMPHIVKGAKIALVNSALEIKKTEIESKINIKSANQIQSFLDEEDKTFRRMAEQVKAAGANVLISQKGIDDVVLHYLAKEGIFALKQVKESDLQKLARATGAKIVDRPQGTQRLRPRPSSDRRAEEGRRGGHDLRDGVRQPAVGLDPHPRRDRARDPGSGALPAGRAQGRLERPRGRRRLPRRGSHGDRPFRQAPKVRPLRGRTGTARRRGVRPSTRGASRGPSRRTAATTRSTR